MYKYIFICQHNDLFCVIFQIELEVYIDIYGCFSDWSNTTLGNSPMALNQSSMTLPYVLYEFTPKWVAILGM